MNAMEIAQIAAWPSGDVSHAWICPSVACNWAASADVMLAIDSCSFLLKCIQKRCVDGVDLTRLVQEHPLHKQPDAADAKCDPPGDQAGYQADARSGTHRDPRGPLAAHVKHDRPGRGSCHPENSQRAQWRNPEESSPAGTASARAARIPGFQSIELASRTGSGQRSVVGGRRIALGAVNKLRQSAGRAIAAIRRNRLMAAIAE